MGRRPLFRYIQLCVCLFLPSVVCLFGFTFSCVCVCFYLQLSVCLVLPSVVFFCFFLPSAECLFGFTFSCVIFFWFYLQLCVCLVLPSVACVYVCFTFSCVCVCLFYLQLCMCVCVWFYLQLCACFTFSCVFVLPSVVCLYVSEIGFPRHVSSLQLLSAQQHVFQFGHTLLLIHLLVAPDHVCLVGVL